MEKPTIRPLAERKNKVHIGEFARVLPPVVGFGEWFDALPDILGARDLKTLVSTWKDVKARGGFVGIALGAHVIKTGLAPLLIDLMRRGLIDHVATNGATAIHDYEFALQGASSEDVAENLPNGSFGFWRETFDGLNGVLVEGARKGFGSAVGEAILAADLPHKDLSIFAEAKRLGVTATVHVAFGCDIVHLDPDLDAGLLGQATHKDFGKICESVCRLGGGLWVNIGSAVLMPEVFLKAVSYARNVGKLGQDFTTANLDMLRQYRAVTNVVQRPPSVGLEIIGQHEILLPLIHQALIAGSKASQATDKETR